VFDLFPALLDYRNNHSILTLQKLCAEIKEFCTAVYSSTENDAERRIFRDMLEKLNKKH
jgi:hypothetical protein